MFWPGCTALKKTRATWLKRQHKSTVFSFGWSLRTSTDQISAEKAFVELWDNIYSHERLVANVHFDERHSLLWISGEGLYRKFENFRVQKFSYKKFSSKKIFGCERLSEN